MLKWRGGVNSGDVERGRSEGVKIWNDGEGKTGELERCGGVIREMREVQRQRWSGGDRFGDTERWGQSSGEVEGTSRTLRGICVSVPLPCPPGKSFGRDLGAAEHPGDGVGRLGMLPGLSAAGTRWLCPGGPGAFWGLGSWSGEGTRES